MGIRRGLKRALAALCPPTVPSNDLGPSFAAGGAEEDTANPIAAEERGYRCGRFDIELTPGHKLPEYRRAHPLYDRFLPVLASALPAGTHVVDVGANVGDTYASMISENPRLHFHCFEPDPEFFKALSRNVAKIQLEAPVQPEFRPDLVNAYVGAGGAIQGALVSRNGSASIKLDAGSENINLIPLDVYLDEHRRVLDSAPLILIKSDVDGFDFGVINSLGKYLLRDDLLLYFECQCQEIFQLEEFTRLIQNLERQGWVFSVFDNFGNVMLIDTDAATVNGLLRYIWRQQVGQASRTVWYLDVLARGKDGTAWVTQTLWQYCGA